MNFIKDLRRLSEKGGTGYQPVAGGNLPPVPALWSGAHPVRPDSHGGCGARADRRPHCFAVTVQVNREWTRMDANLGCSGNSLSFIRVH